MGALSLTLDTPNLARTYEERSVDRQFRHGQQLIADLAIRPGEHVLDIGAGTGLLADYVARVVGPNGSVLGIDPLPLRIEIAKRRADKNLRFEVGNAYSLDQLPSSHFDVVYLNQVLHWLPEKAKPLEQIHRVLRPNGRLGIASGSKNHPGGLQVIRKKILAKEPYHQYPESLDGAPHWVTVGELAQLLEDAGFDPTRIELQDNEQTQPDSDFAVEFAEASSFGNFLGHLPPTLRTLALAEIKRALEAFRTPEGIRLVNKRLVAIARKPKDSTN